MNDVRRLRPFGLGIAEARVHKLFQFFRLLQLKLNRQRSSLRARRVAAREWNRRHSVHLFTIRP